jgi:hypothetical protein
LVVGWWILFKVFIQSGKSIRVWAYSILGRVIFFRSLVWKKYFLRMGSKLHNFLPRNMGDHTRKYYQEGFLFKIGLQWMS